MAGQRKGGLVLRVVPYRYLLRDDVPGLPHHDGIANIHAQLVDKVLIVQGGAAYGGARQLYRVKSAVGVTAPVRPTCNITFRSTVSFSSGGYL